MAERPAASGAVASVQAVSWPTRLAIAVATGFGTGYSPVIPGTVGSMLGVPLVILLKDSIGPGAFVSGPLIVVLCALVGVWCGHVAERVFGRKDDRRIVVDEVAGYLVTMLWNPATAGTLLIGFVLSRFFDIVKPFPAHRSQRLKGGWGIMADDLIAGVYANVVLRLVVFLLFKEQVP